MGLPNPQKADSPPSPSQPWFHPPLEPESPVGDATAAIPQELLGTQSVALEMGCQACECLGQACDLESVCNITFLDDMEPLNNRLVVLRGVYLQVRHEQPIPDSTCFHVSIGT